jgi:hypothetical protein
MTMKGKNTIKGKKGKNTNIAMKSSQAIGGGVRRVRT